VATPHPLRGVLPHFWRAVDQHRTALHILESRGRVTDGGEGTGKVKKPQLTVSIF
jgi:hypothetical protein